MISSEHLKTDFTGGDARASCEVANGPVWTDTPRPGKTAGQEMMGGGHTR